MASEKTSGGNPLIVLLTDFKWADWYVAVMKGVILGINPLARIFDLCHNVSTEDVGEGSFILGNSHEYFPEGTIFVCVVDPGVGGDRKNLIVQTDRHIFLSPDNGILSSIFETGRVRKVFSVGPGRFTLEPKGSTFLGRDIFAPIAARLSLGIKPGEMGKEEKSVLIIPPLKPLFNPKGGISGRAVYVDSFGNIITNVPGSFIRSSFGEGVAMEELEVRAGKNRIRGIHRYYGQGAEGKLMALLDSWGYMEIAVNRGSAYEKLELTEKKSFEVFISCPGASPEGER